jgi:hypothetical protein
MNINAKISLFANYWDVTPEYELSIYQFYENIIDSDYLEEVAQVRNGNKWVKKKLPGVTISGTFTTRDTKIPLEEKLIKHSGFICIDIDDDHNPNIEDWEGLRDTLGSWEEVLISALSVSAKGVFLVIPLAYPHKHKAQYLALEKDFKAFGLVTDKQTKDVTRLRGITSDPKAVWNPTAKPYQKYIIEPKTSHSKPKASPEISKLIGWTERNHGMFTVGNRNNYITQLAGACHRLGISQLEVESHLKQYQQSGFSEREILATIRSTYANKQYSPIT